MTVENQEFDLSPDGIINLFDFFVFVGQFNETLPGKRSVYAVDIDEDTVIGLEPFGGTRADDGLVTVRVWAEVEELKAFGLEINYDPDTVEFVEASQGAGDLLESKGGSAPLFQVLSNRPGEVTLGNGITVGDPVSGQGLLAELKFRLIGSANETYFSIREALVVDGDRETRLVRQVRSTRLMPQTYYLGGNFPNPFNPRTTIEYALPNAGRIQLEVFDLLGQKVRSLVKEDQHAAGFYTAVWDGRDERGRDVGSGVYVYRLRAPAFVKTQKMLLIK